MLQCMLKGDDASLKPVVKSKVFFFPFGMEIQIGIGIVDTLGGIECNMQNERAN